MQFTWFAPRFFAALGALAALGCGGAEPVTRVLSGELVDGPPIPSDAYGAFLAGALAEAAGNLDEAARLYARTTRRDPESAEPWARLALVSCRRGDRDAGEAAIARARSLDPDDATIEEAAAACSAPAEARVHLASAAKMEPTEAALVRELAARDIAGGHPEAARARIEGFLLRPTTSPELRITAAELALRAGQSARAAELALGAAALSSTYAVRTARVAVAIAGREPERGRALAAALVDLGPLGAGGKGRVATQLEAEPLVFRLAIDHALLGGDADKALARAAKGAVPIGEVVGRALLLGAFAPARAIVPVLELEQPGEATVARLVLGDAARVPAASALGDDPPDALVLALATYAAHALEPAAARALVASLPAPRVDPRDRLLADAAARAGLPAAPGRAHAEPKSTALR